MTREQGFEIARKAAKDHNYDVTRYVLDTFGRKLSEGGTEWIYVFNCKAVPAPPGCFFMVTVDRRTGNAEVLRGQ